MKMLNIAVRGCAPELSNTKPVMIPAMVASTRAILDMAQRARLFGSAVHQVPSHPRIKNTAPTNRETRYLFGPPMCRPRSSKNNQVTPGVATSTASSFDTQARSPQGYYGLGQMGKAACRDVDAAYGLAPGTCWRNQQSNDPCAQMANSIAYLHHVLVNKNDFGHDGSIRGGLKKYGPVDAPFGEYADPILDCAKCVREKERYHTEDDGPPRGVEFCTPEGAQDCFDEMNDQVRKARKERGL